MSKKKKTLEQLMDEVDHVEDANRNVVFIKIGNLIRTQKGKKPKELIPVKKTVDFVPYVNIDLMSGAKKNEIQYADKNENVVLCIEQDILMVWDGARSGFVGRGVSGIIGSTLSKIEIPLVLNDYLYQFLKFQFEYLNKNTRGTGIPHVDPLVLNELEFPLYSLSEQKRISDIIENLFSKIDEAKNFIEEVKVSFELRRAGFLDSVFKGKYNNFSLQKNFNEWEKVKTDKIFEFITSGSRGWAKYYSDEGDLFLRVGNLKHESITLDIKDLQYVNLPENVEGKRTRVQVDDILISITADIGRIAVIEEGLPTAYINQHVALARPKKEFYSKYIGWYLASKTGGKRQMEALQRGATKVGLGLEDIKNITIPMPCIEDQKKIVALIENTMIRFDEVEKSLIESLQTCDNLKKNILSKAFKGELGTHDPTDEPAIDLLKSILQEKL